MRVIDGLCAEEAECLCLRNEISENGECFFLNEIESFSCYDCFSA